MASKKETTKKEAAASDIKAALETFAGHEIDASPEQVEQRLRNLTFPFSAYTFTPGDDPGEVVSRSIFPFLAPFCYNSELLDVGGVAATGNGGSATILVTNFLCPSEAARVYSEPVNIVATAVSASPALITVTHSLVSAAPNSFATNVQINIFAWDASGAPAPGVTVNWRCRVPTSALIQ